jgi:Domain of unknown function (DUF222)/HNH endonuclease
MEVAARSERIAAIDRAVASMVAASAELLEEVARWDREKLWEADGATSMASWLAARYRVAWGTAREWVRVAHALERLPEIARAYAVGRLSWDQLVPLTRFATPETDRAWAEQASRLRPAGLWREARRHERIRVKQAREIHRQRYLSLQWDHERPVMWLEGLLPAEEGAALETALAHRSEQLPSDPDAIDPGGARLADALVNLVQGNSIQPPTLVIHTGAEVLAGLERKAGPWLAETEGGQRLSSETVRRLACDGKVEWVLRDRNGVVGMGRRGRAVPGALARILRYRDRTCRFPGCEHKRWLHAHHLIHWARGGATDLANLVLLCGFHHRLVHEGGWRTSGHPGRDLRFHDPRGRTLTPFRGRAPDGMAPIDRRKIAQPLLN